MSLDYGSCGLVEGDRIPARFGIGFIEFRVLNSKPHKS